MQTTLGQLVALLHDAFEQPYQHEHLATLATDAAPLGRPA